MKALLRNVTVAATALILAAIPVFAVEGVMGQQEPQVQKNECLLVAQNCPTDSIQERINRIESEINKGTTIYSTDELQRLNRELDEAKRLLDYELMNSGSVVF